MHRSGEFKLRWFQQKSSSFFLKNVLFFSLHNSLSLLLPAFADAVKYSLLILKLLQDDYETKLSESKNRQNENKQKFEAALQKVKEESRNEIERLQQELDKKDGEIVSFLN